MPNGTSIFRKRRINLAMKKQHRGAATMVWYIAKENNGKNYYITEIDKDTRAVTWTPIRKDSIQFATEQAVHTFIHAYLKERNDIFLVHAPEED